jgi:hypothetical protein
MRLNSRALTRSWLTLALAVLTVLPAGAAAAAPKATPAPTPNRLPHVAGGYVAGKTRVAAKVPAFGAHASAVLPDAVDLRPYAPPVGDQGQVGSCVAWSIAHGIMGYYANRTGGVGAPYAPLFLYMRNVAPGGAPNAGLYPDAVLANALSAGVDTQADYWQGTTNYQTPPTAAQIANATKYKISGWNRLFNGANQGDPAKVAIQQALASGSPVALGFSVFPDFMSLRTHTLYNTLSGTNLGGHMVAAFGYDSQGVWIRNSWGTWWGNSGDVKVSWAFITKVVSGAYTVSGITTPAAPVAMAPTVASLSIAKATAGTSVTVTGAGLAGATAVRFGNDPATFSPVTADGVTKLVATAPAHDAGVVDVTVTNATGTSEVSAASKFTYIPPVPAVTGLSPNTVSTVGGTAVTLTGTGLTGATAVKLGTLSVTAKEVTATSLTFIAPAHAAEAVNVTVTNAGGTSTVGAATKLSWVKPPAPVITSIAPSSALTTVATPVVVTGTDFTGATKVTSGGSNIAFVKVSNTSLKLTMPVHAAGAVALQITTPSGVSTVNANSSFTYRLPPAPAITAITPKTGLTYVRTPVVVTGANLGGVTKLTVDGVAVTFTKVNDTSLKVTLPVHAAGEFDVRVTGPGGLSATGSDARFGYLAPPVPKVSVVAPSSGSTKVANTVMLNGSGFTGATKVTGNGTVMTFVKLSETQLRVNLPPRSAGPVALVVTAPGGLSTAVTYTAVAPPPPAITTLSAKTGLTYVPTPLVLNGTGFGGASKVTLGGTTVAFTRISDTQLKVTAPVRPAGAVPIVVTALGGTSAAATFTYVAPPVPTLTAIAPGTGYTDRTTEITLTGKNLTAASKLTSGGATVAFVKVSDTQLTLTLPAHAAGAVAVVVTTPGGTSAPVSFTYVLPPAPVVTALSPSGGAANKATAVTVAGTAFTGATKLTLGGVAVAFTHVSATQLKVTLPAKAAGTYDLVVTGPGGSNVVGAQARYTYT